MSKRKYTSRDIAELCGISRNLVTNINSRGYLIIASSELNPDGKAPYKLVQKKYEIAPCSHERAASGTIRNYYNKKTLDTFLEATYAARENWPTADELETFVCKTTRTRVIQLWRNGKISGRTSLGRYKVRISPEDARLLKMSVYYSIRNAARMLKVPEPYIYDWNRAAKTLGIPFLENGVGIRKKYVPPRIIQRLKQIMATEKCVAMDSLKHLKDSTADFEYYLSKLPNNSPNS